MDRWLGPYSGYIYVALRIVAGFMFAQHGAQKLFGLLGGTQQPLFSQMGLAGIIEFFGGIFIAVGLLTTWAAFIASGEMAWAYFQAHTPQGFWPIQNRGNLAALYCFVFLYVASRGAGPLSIDRLLGRRDRWQR